jgi:hypothetical protein
VGVWYLVTGDPRTERDRAPDDGDVGVDLDDPVVRAAFSEHLPELRKSASGNRMLYGTLVLGCVLGLAAHIGGFLIKMSSPAEPLAVVGDLLYALGWALWTGCVVVVFVQVIPDVKRRQIAREVEAYEAPLRDDDGATRR